MIILGRGQAVSATIAQAQPNVTPPLLFIGHNQGQLVAASSLAFRILDVSTPEKEAAGGVQVYPVSGTQPIDLINDAYNFDPNTTNGGGYYVAPWTVPSNEPIGRHEIEWTYALTVPVSSTYTSIATEPAPSGIVRQPFDVIAGAAPYGPFYALISDVREDLGCTPQKVTDRKLIEKIGLASKMIEAVTGRFFNPRLQFLRLSGNSARKLFLPIPIIAISSCGIDTQPTQAGDLVVDLDLFRIYNRHLSQGMVGADDDRNNPKIEFVHSDDLYGVRFIPFRGISLRSLAFPIGVQNIHVRGAYGFTDPDGSPWGQTPQRIQHVTKLIVARELPKIGDRDAREDAQHRWRVISDKAKDIEVDLAPPRAFGPQAFGDPEIDSILASYVRPPSMGSA